MIGLFIAAVTIFFGYIITTLIKFGIPESVSATHYLWNKAFNNGGLLFTATLVLVGFLVIPPWISVSPDDLTMCPFISSAALVFVGCAAAFKEELTSSVHYTSAVIWATMVLIYATLTGCYMFVIFGAFFALIGMLLNKWSNITFWLEIGAVLIMIDTIAYQLIGI